MISVVLKEKEGFLQKFEIRGHSTVDSDDEQGKIICSAVSSAAIMAANTITDIIGDKADVICSDGLLSVAVKDPSKTKDVLLGLKLHLTELENEYPDRIKVIMEVEP
jgi:uncharacterized protein YsxB (DUF464 family)